MKHIKRTVLALLLAVISMCTLSTQAFANGGNIDDRLNPNSFPSDMKFYTTDENLMTDGKDNLVIVEAPYSEKAEAVTNGLTTSNRDASIVAIMRIFVISDGGVRHLIPLDMLF